MTMSKNTVFCIILIAGLYMVFYRPLGITAEEVKVIAAVIVFLAGIGLFQDE